MQKHLQRAKRRRCRREAVAHRRAVLCGQPYGALVEQRWCKRPLSGRDTRQRTLLCAPLSPSSPLLDDIRTRTRSCVTHELDNEVALVQSWCCLAGELGRREVDRLECICIRTNDHMRGGDTIVNVKPRERKRVGICERRLCEVVLGSAESALRARASAVLWLFGLCVDDAVEVSPVRLSAVRSMAAAELLCEVQSCRLPRSAFAR